MKRLVVKFLEDRYTWDGKEVEGNKEKSLRQQLAKVSSEIALRASSYEPGNRAGSVTGSNFVVCSYGTF